MKKMNYTTVEELLLTDGFLKWYEQTDEKEVQAWDEWIAENPKHQRLANDQTLLLIRLAKENRIAEQEINSAATRLANAIRNMKSSYNRPVKNLRINLSL